MEQPTTHHGAIVADISIIALSVLIHFLLVLTLKPAAPQNTSNMKHHPYKSHQQIFLRK
jgi:hypothetical protein